MKTPRGDSPSSRSVSPARGCRGVPWRSRRASCAEVSLGNICARRCSRRLFATVAPTDRVESRRDFHHQLIDVAPAPILARFDRRHDGVVRRMEVLSRVPILRVVTTTDMPAGPAEPQMDPAIAELEALFAPATTRLIGPHEIQMTALFSHETRKVEPARDPKRW